MRSTDSSSGSWIVRSMKEKRSSPRPAGTTPSCCARSGDWPSSVAAARTSGWGRVPASCSPPSPLPRGLDPGTPKRSWGRRSARTVSAVSSESAGWEPCTSASASTARSSDRSPSRSSGGSSTRTV